MTELSLSAEELVTFLFIHATDDIDPLEERITIECNYCVSKKTIFFEGDDSDTPSGTWLADAAVHVNEYHKDRLTR